MHRRPWTWLDTFVAFSTLPAIWFAVIAYQSIPIEETHPVGNDAPLYDLVILLCALWVVGATAVLVLRRLLPNGVQSQWNSERQQWREMRASRRRGGT